MPRTREIAGSDVSEKRAESEEQVNLDEDNDPEETIEEEVEYEEIEEEIEVEEDEDEEEEEETGAQEDEKRKHAELLALPPHGSEVYLGGIPQGASDEDLRSFCESIGEVTEVRIMKAKDSGESKGYAFVTFRTKEMASEAIEKLNNSELKGKRVKCSSSQAKNKLFIGNVPRVWGEDDIRKVVTKVGPGVTTIELIKDPQNSSRNRGYAFIEYYNNACAEYSRQKMSNSDFKLEDNAPTVSWADPRNSDSSAAASQVKALYIKNLPKDITQERLQELFEHNGKITKVVVPPAKPGQENSRYGFVHFAERSSAMKALKNTEKYEIDGQVLDCSLAKPQTDQKSSGGPNSHNPMLNPSFPPQLGYGGLVGSALGFGHTGFGEPMIYGRGPTPAGMSMMPMLLPDGRIGYVLQQPGMQQPHTPPPNTQRGRGTGGGSSGGRRGGSDSGRGRSRYNPY